MRSLQTIIKTLHASNMGLIIPWQQANQQKKNGNNKVSSNKSNASIIITAYKQNQRHSMSKYKNGKGFPYTNNK